jgi:hypothetical protein
MFAVGLEFTLALPAGWSQNGLKYLLALPPPDELGFVKFEPPKAIQ